MSDLRPVHIPADVDPGNKAKIIAGIIVAAVIVVTGAFGWQAGWFKGMHEAVPYENLPQASMPLNAKPG